MSPLIWQYVGIFLASLVVLLIGLLLWRRRELRRTRAIEVAEILASWGMETLAKLFRAYAVGNYLGKDSVTRTIHEIIDEIQSGGLPAMLKKVGWKVVEGVFLKNPEDRTRLQTLLNTTTASAVLASPVPPPPSP